jgi:tRNA U34 5-methylaminomethyl-2-thiouridine-forming methyltransferase MnmC
LRREIIKTADGSVTIHLPEWNEQYHSKHGAISEAVHVFIDAGLHYYTEKHPNQSISILEIGFGTGLNAFLTLLESEKRDIKINYTGVEAYPIEAEEIEKLNYAEQVNTKRTNFLALHISNWEEEVNLNANFNLTKRQQFFSEIKDVNSFDIIYFDAFGARVQPDLWTESIFSSMYLALKEKGVLVTYAAKGSVRRAMQAVGFTVERLPGPPGKREMLRAVK